MQIIKRNGTTESYDREKIAVAIRKSFISTQKEITDEAVYTIVDEVEQFLHQNEANRSVERIQDEVERSLSLTQKPKTIYFTVGSAQKEEKSSVKSLPEPVMIL